MEETVPLASNIAAGGGSTRERNNRVQHRTTAAAAAASSSSSSGSTNENANRTTTTTRRTGGGIPVPPPSSSQQSTSLITSLLSPTFLISKLIIIISILLKIALYPLRKISYTLFPLREFDGLNRDGVSDKAAQSFCKMFSTQYITPRYCTAGNTNRTNYGGNNEEHHELLTTCPFATKGYMNTIQQITNQHAIHQQSISNLISTTFVPTTEPPPPLLLIYLHSPFHSSTNNFCTQKLCSNRILTYLNTMNGGLKNTVKAGAGEQQHQQQQPQNLVCWGGSIHTADGKNVQSMMNVTSFPFMALVRVRPQSSSSSSNNNNTTTKANLEIYFRIEGHKLSTISTNTLYTYISRSIHEYNTIQNEEISRVIARQEEIHLRNEQDREYKQALEEAQRIEREKEEEELRKKEEERLKEEEERRMKMEKENKINEANRILFLFGDEPDGKNKDMKCVRIRLMLPSGKKLQRRFRGEETIDTVKSFLILHFEDMDDDDDGKIDNFQLSSNYPKKALIDGSATLESEGLCPQAVIMVQDLDA